MLVTVMSDASYCHQTKAAGWGVWIKSERGFFEGGGNFKTQAKTSTDAESMAISVAVFLAFKQGIAVEGDIILIQTDCLAIVNMLQKFDKDLYKSRRKLKPFQKAVKYTERFIRENKCTLKIRHVKGHAPSEGKRNYVNELCDKHARKAMQEQRRTLQ